ncbi:hypothetical protein SAMN02787118_11830 [Streptomyces mirabilis]|uniref:Uncharacterized protein n=2 Tax=Streptomyces mirabilis TaxID=68239 RepID=A0A1I2QIA5_9ACTN|nr:hypothetical protein SAMN02787118_11830 [Streptomyces mirabilis]
MRQLREKLLEMQRQWRIFDTWGELKPLAEAVYLDSDLLLNEELRSRVRGDLYAILLVDHYAGPSNQIVLTRSESVVYLCQDASGCIAAHIRGSGVPPISREVSQCLWYYAQMRARIDFAVQARMDARDALIDLI